ncbi:acyl-CoA-binding domain-containing protein 5-like isoform X2 [Penaeus chinensis]|uniref:acyl-CoA-binding domain-containing protein 5-like isoform X2 n=1 Tax=Penaeus chinensis TaxID=139456 RepID=UPI001FB70539|nr:acyl-CoA-binding domain-containing protein 5-like isoform X2 [Penaeus chinensis]
MKSEMKKSHRAQESPSDKPSRVGGEGRAPFLHADSILQIPHNMTTEDKFQAAVNIIRSLPKDGPYQPSHDMMLKFYALYKQAVEGPCNEPKPAFYEVVRGYKWRAWSSLGNMSKAEAMNTYVEELKKAIDLMWPNKASLWPSRQALSHTSLCLFSKVPYSHAPLTQIIETMAYTEDVANFIDALGPFYEFIDIPGTKNKNNNNNKGNDKPDNDKKDDSAGDANDKPLTNGLNMPGKMNGIHNPDSDSGSGSEAAQSSSQDSSPQHSREETITQEVREEAEILEEEEEELVVVEVRTEREDKTTHTLTLSPRVLSDTDSDEEYSEPAEESTSYPAPAPALLSQHVPVSSSSSDDAVTCGGGDQSHPGGLQMTPRQSQQRFSGTPLYTSQVSSGSLATPIHSGGFTRGSGGGGSGGDGGRGGSTDIVEDVNAQLVVVLRRLQADMESVLHRLNTLETITLSQHHTVCHHCQTGSSNTPTARMEPSWWPFPELSPRSTFFLLVWPLILHGGIKLLLLLRSRRRQR